MKDETAGILVQEFAELNGTYFYFSNRRNTNLKLHAFSNYFHIFIFISLVRAQVAISQDFTIFISI